MIRSIAYIDRSSSPLIARTVHAAEPGGEPMIRKNLDLSECSMRSYLTTYQLLVPPFDKGGLGGIFKAVRLMEAREIPLNPPFPKGEADLRPCEQKVMGGKRS